MTGRGTTASIAVCEDDDSTMDLLCEQLRADHYAVLPASTATDALRLCRYNDPDLLLLDLALPGAAGFDVLKEIRGSNTVDASINSSLAIIALTGRDGPSDRARALDSGADDHVQKPFTYEELRVRIEAALRRRHNRHDNAVRIGEILIDPSRHRVIVGEREVHLTNREFTLLRVLASDPSRIFSKDELLREVWGFRTPDGRTRTLDAHASRLRRSLDPENLRYVVNSWGVGYRLTDQIEEVRILPERDGEANPWAGS